ncbi:hypothetical protein GGI23_004347 [Coemansia sp. RSA 2559]|nr:hypothetical protein GGI23_004347 [Coemansia sp. RSA 2559]
MSDNISVLTKGHKTYAKKRKARHEQVEEVQFDPDARRTFLTGFHKRKMERREQAIALAKQREREDKLEMRREHRQAQKEQLAHKIMLNKGINGELDADKEESGSEEEIGKGNEEEEEGEEEEVLHGDSAVTTVTVTRDFDPTRIGDEDLRLDAKLSAQEIAFNVERDALKTLRHGDDSSDDDAKAKAKSKNAKQDKKKKPTKKFRYETKAKRSTTSKAATASKKKKAMGSTAKPLRRR